jgi:hypothetical protein
VILVIAIASGGIGDAFFLGGRTHVVIMFLLKFLERSLLLVHTFVRLFLKARRVPF